MSLFGKRDSSKPPFTIPLGLVSTSRTNLSEKQPLAEDEVKTTVPNSNHRLQGYHLEVVENYVKEPVNKAVSNTGYFAPENTFLLLGHGTEIISNSKERYILQPNQHMMIPGQCGSLLRVSSTEQHDLYSLKNNIPIFNKGTTNDSSYLFRKVSINSVNNSRKTSLAKYNKYFPGKGVPSLMITPFSTHINKTPDGDYIYVIVSGILQKTRPYTFPDAVLPSQNNNLYKGDTEKLYTRKTKLDVLTLDVRLGEAEKHKSTYEVLNNIKESLGGSVLTFRELISLAILSKYSFAGKGYTGITSRQIYEIVDGISREEGNNSDRKITEYYNELTLRDLLSLRVPLEFFFHFLDSKTNAPYLLILNVCRAVNDVSISKDTIFARRRASMSGSSRRFAMRKTKRIKKRR